MLAHHLGLDGGVLKEQTALGRRYATAALLARLFGSYGDNRPAMLTDWALGSHDTDGAGDNLGYTICAGNRRCGGDCGSTSGCLARPNGCNKARAQLRVVARTGRDCPSGCHFLDRPG